MPRTKNAALPEPPPAPEWLIELSRKTLELRHPTYRKSAGDDFARGATYGHQLAELCVYREPSKATRPAEGFAVLDPKHEQQLHESHVWIAEQISKGCDLPRARAHKYFQGVVFALKPQRRKRKQPSDDLTADIYDILSFNSLAVDALPTRKAIADLVLRKLPQHRQLFLAKNESAKNAFDLRIEQICKSIKLSPAKRGHPRNS